MPAALRPYVTAGVALVGASVISAAPIQPTPSTERVVRQDYQLTAASTVTCVPGDTSALCGDAAGAALPDLTANAVVGTKPSLLYVPVNLLNMFLSVPASEIQAMDRLADAMIATGSWQVWSPTNVFGFDEQDPPKLTALVDMVIPFKPFSSVLGEQLSWWARANLPMNAGCAALPGACPDLGALLDGMFNVPMSELYAGYQFPTVTNPFTGEETTWSGDPVKLEPWGPFTSTWEYLTAPPTGVETVSLGDYLTVPLKFGKSLVDAFYPFVQNSEWYNDDQTKLAPLFRALAPILCPSCDPDNPYDNPYLYENYPPNQAPGEAAANTGILSGVDQKSETADPVTSAVTGLRQKFKFAKTTAEPAAESVTEVPDGVAETVTDAVTDAGEPAAAAETEDTPDASPVGSRRSGTTGRHHKSDGDDSTSVKSIRDKIRSARSGSASGSTTESEKTDSGSSDTPGGGSDE